MLETGLSKATAAILESGGFDTRQKVIEAGAVRWLMLPNFGEKRLHEVNAWLGRDAEPVRREIARYIETLRSYGYTVKPPRQRP